MGRKNNLKKKIIYSVVCFTLFFQQIGFAQMAQELNIAAHLANMHSGISIDKFRPLHLRYFSYDLKSDNFKFLFDKGDFEKGLSPFKEETQTLLKYFLIGITLPDSKFWVNLRPDSEDQIIEPELEQTDLGKVLLEADLQLKKDTSLYTSPQTPEGREYWNKLYKKAEELFGSENITIPTLTRPWIVPGEIIIRETEESAFIYKSTLKVMLEEDYLAGNRGQVAGDSLQDYTFKDPRLKELNAYSSQLIRELIIPKLTKEVNTSKRYAPLRQVFYSLILSRWFKARFKGLSPQGTDPFYVNLIDSQNLNGLISKDSWSKTTYFKEYQKSFNHGEYNLKEPVHTPTGQVIRSYFSGGIMGPTIKQVTGVGVPEGQNVPIDTIANPSLIRAVSDSSIMPTPNNVSLPIIREDSKPAAASPVIAQVSKEIRISDILELQWPWFGFWMGRYVKTKVKVIEVKYKEEDVSPAVELYIARSFGDMTVTVRRPLDGRLDTTLVASLSFDIPNQPDRKEIINVEIPKGKISITKDLRYNLITFKKKFSPEFILTLNIGEKAEGGETKDGGRTASSPVEGVALLDTSDEIDFWYAGVSPEVTESLMEAKQAGIFRDWEDVRQRLIEKHTTRVVNHLREIVDDGRLRATDPEIRKLAFEKFNSANVEDVKRWLQESGVFGEKRARRVAYEILPSDQDRRATNLKELTKFTAFQWEDSWQRGKDPMRLMREKSVAQFAYYLYGLVEKEPKRHGSPSAASLPAMNDYGAIPEPYGRWFRDRTRIRVIWNNVDMQDTLEGVIVNVSTPQTDPVIWLEVEGEDKDQGIFVRDIFSAKEIGNSADQAGSSPLGLDASLRSASIPERGKPGGIDFRVMNIVTQPLVSSSSLNLKLPELANLAEFDLDEEFKQLKNMLAAGIMPSGARIKEFLAACQQKGEWNIRIADIISCLIEICRLEEDNVSDTPLEIKEALIIADSGNLGS